LLLRHTPSSVAARTLQMGKWSSGDS
jgi:hypothetical protein